MISTTRVSEYILSFAIEETDSGVQRRVVDSNQYGKIYLHPEDPRFGCDNNHTLYSFRRAMGHSKWGDRCAGVDYSRPRILKGHSGYNGEFWISIEPYKKVKKDVFINRILKG